MHLSTGNNLFALSVAKAAERAAQGREVKHSPSLETFRLLRVPRGRAHPVVPCAHYARAQAPAPRRRSGGAGRARRALCGGGGAIMAGSAGSAGGSARKRLMKEEDMTKVEFETSEEVDVTPTFDTMGLREDLLRGIYAYGGRRGRRGRDAGRGRGAGDVPGARSGPRAGAGPGCAACALRPPPRPALTVSVLPQGSRSRRPSSSEPSSRSSRAGT